ncbi:hypothetical protein RhiirC2_785750 [Rhizophagus irregularis]|uniref:Crinkler effector protein N-terminal domain-containing protein n=1 Tax=Rhizophagus irregularis TaxID=588596 RepID=A0A2N1MVR7_9GLOM|nr:hypothetical protein RhiirC2_785750 [Rhizophagus irregularis]
MSVTLLCLVKGNMLANAFTVKISSDEPVSELKDIHYFDELWKVEIGGDHLDDQLKNLKLNGSDELSAINEIGEYWTEKPPKKHIHVLVEPPVSTTASNEKSSAFDIVVSPKRTKGFKWTVNIEDATFEGLKNSIREKYPPPSLENDVAVLNIINDSEKFSPRNDQDLLCELYGLSDVYPVFSCKLFDELEMRVATTPINDIPEKLIEGKNGRRNLDYGIESRTTVGLVEVKKDDFKQGFAQATVQLVSSLGHKRKADKMVDEPGFNKTPLFVAYEDEDIKEKAVKVLGHIIWLLEESQKANSAVNEKVIKKRKSLSKVAGNSDTVDKP